MRFSAMAWLACVVAGIAAAQEPPPQPQQSTEAGGCYLVIKDIAFEGNDTTQPKTMLREMVLEIGDTAEPALVERSRQGVMDLGLFKTVSVREEIIEGGVRLVFIVDERWYVLPLPRVDLKSDGQYAYGGQVRWANVMGLNHSLRASWVRADRKLKNIGKESTWSASYGAPFIFESEYGVSGGAAYTSRPVEDEITLNQYNETLASATAGVTRSLSEGPASQGWTLGGGLTWSNETTSGITAPPAYGTAISPYVTLSFRDFHNRTYSDIGVIAASRLDWASQTLGSDYQYTNWSAYVADYLPLGTKDDQTIHFIGKVGTYFGGPSQLHPYSLGGSSDLRGYESNFIEGDGFYLFQVEVARPVIWRWLRAVAILEAGNVFTETEDANLRNVYTSLGLGLRVRLTSFVNLELEAGFAIPLTGGHGGGRFFASKV
jgi:outer membrane protein assembly factor BamA